MQKQTIISATLVVLTLLAGFIFWAFQRGVITYTDGVFGFSRSAITNPTPSLNRAYSFPAHFTQEAKDIYLQNVGALKETLKSDPASFDAWLDLAIYYRMIGDHAGAVEVWEYLRSRYGEDGISRHNLADYYFREKKDYAKAEEYFRESIAVAPTLESNYLGLYELYRYAYKQDTTAAVDILKEGITKLGTPSQVQFNIMIGRHYRDVLNDRANARVYLTAARDLAQEIGNRSLASELTREINALR